MGGDFEMLSADRWDIRPDADTTAGGGSGA